MKYTEAVRQSLLLLPRRDRFVIGGAISIQMLTAFLDLAGVLLVGVFATLGMSNVNTSGSTSNALLSRLGLNQVVLGEHLASLMVIAGALLIGKSLINIVLNRKVLRFLANRQAVISTDIASALLSRPLLEVENRSSQETAFALTSGVLAATMQVLGQAVAAAAEVSLLIVLAAGLFFIDPLITLFSIAFFSVIAIALQKSLAGKANSLGRIGSLAQIKSTAAVQEAVRTYREMTVSNRRGFYVDKFSKARWETASVQAELNFMAMAPKYIFEIALIIGAALLAFSQFLAKDTTNAIATIAVFLVAGSRIVPSMLRLQSAGFLIKSGAGEARTAFELTEDLGFKPQDRESRKSPPHQNINVFQPKDFEPTVTIRNLSFNYPGSNDLSLNNITLHIKSGSSLAIVGPTGAGKSTLTDVILGVIFPSSGTVEVNGLSPSLATVQWPGLIAYVPQEVAIVDGTVAENVALGLPVEEIDEDAVWNALHRAHIGDFLKEMREGLQTRVGEHGVKLSGGQRQRLGIARALYTEPLLLVMDEATSALDAETEQSIVATMKLLEGNATTITIAHRLATVRHADQVAYIQDGALLAIGTFEEVRSAVPEFDKQALISGLN